MDNTFEINSNQAIKALLAIIILGFIAIISFSIASKSITTILNIGGMLVIIAGSSFTLGGFVGFLFAIPRTFSKFDQNQSADTPTNEKTDLINSYYANTNLEQISDWLTKILVGVGLTQMNRLYGLLKEISTMASSNINSEIDASVFVFFLIIFYLVTGFLISYIWTRIHFAGFLYDADRKNFENTLSLQIDNLETQYHNVNSKITTLKNQDESDKEAIELVDFQLSSTKEDNLLEQDKIDKVLANASAHIRKMVFYRIRTMIHESEKIGNNKFQLIVNTIPIIKGLIKSDSNNHKIHAYFGIALMNIKSPDLKSALKEFNIAIDLRGPWETSGILSYEFYRVLCYIKMSKSNTKTWISDTEEKNNIIQDIKSITSGGNYDQLASVNIFHSWMEANSIDKKLFFKDE